MPEWKLKSLARNMGAVFVGESIDAALLCSDPAFSYFVITGSLMPRATAGRAPSLLVARPSSGSGSSSGGGHPLFPEERAVGSTATMVSETATYCNQLQSPISDFREELTCNQLQTANYAFRAEGGTCNQLRSASDALRGTETGVEEVAAAAAAAAAAAGRQSEEHGCPVIAGSVRDPEMPLPARDHHRHHHHHHHQLTVRSRTPSNAAPTPINGVPPSSLEQDNTTQPLFPGQSLDMYVCHQMNRQQVGGTEKKETEEKTMGRQEIPTGTVSQSLHSHARGQANRKVGIGEEHGETMGHGTPVAVAADGPDRPKGPRGWRLEARQAACIGRVSRRFLQELEIEEPRRELEEKIGFLRRTEVNKLMGVFTRKKKK